MFLVASSVNRSDVDDLLPRRVRKTSPRTPSAMRITPIVFITPSSAADSDRAPRPSSSFLKRSNVGPATAIGGLSHSFPGQLYTCTSRAVPHSL